MRSNKNTREVAVDFQEKFRQHVPTLFGRPIIDFIALNKTLFRFGSGMRDIIWHRFITNRYYLQYLEYVTNFHVFLRFIYRHSQEALALIDSLPFASRSLLLFVCRNRGVHNNNFDSICGTNP